ncbi:unnamed protein product [Albugo candida]|uniref:Uncharacterized protein n=1 Tax=Albugo candida TaxID=65357 RepID=A0A024GF32_9STRA|nr:unnamed protein product [Albugo candida]|eukprot:CCI45150.1 unnamed protein product [Albugo candida]
MENTSVECDGNEFGLENLGHLPLLEQIHRLLHAIQNDYPYKETKGWKSLTVKQKREMLEYIKYKQIGKVTTNEQQERKEKTSAYEEIITRVDTEKKEAMRPDPYLEMIRKRNIRNISGSKLKDTRIETRDHFITECAHELQDATRSSKLKGSSRHRWKVMDEEFYGTKPCFCGKTHAIVEKKNAKSDMKVIDTTIRSIMITFGDAAEPCIIYRQIFDSSYIVGEFTRNRLKAMDEESTSGDACLRTLVDLFQEEAMYYGRWREFKTETKQENDLETIKEEELAEELNFFAVSEANGGLSEEFLTRIKFADERTQKMDWVIYDSFSQDRRKNFMVKKGVPFKEWLKISDCSQASLEFLNFVVYYNIGRLVELAIKYRAGGILLEQRDSLLTSDISAIIETFDKSTAAIPPKRDVPLKQKKRKAKKMAKGKDSYMACNLNQDSRADELHKGAQQSTDSGIRLKRLR